MNGPTSSSAPPAPVARDRSGALAGYGWLLIAVGALCGVLALLVLAASSLAPAGGTRVPVRPEGAALYAMLGATLLVLGTGSIRARRWARALIVVVLWLWLLTGAGGFLLLALLFPRLVSASAGGSAAGGAVTCVTVFVLLFSAIFLVALPTLLLLFYRREDVRSTVERRDPEVSWTDRLPESLLGIVVALALGAAVSVLSIFSLRAVPLFGLVLTGRGAVLCLLLFGVLSVLLTLAVARKSPAGWWGLVVFQVLGLANFLTVRQIDMESLLRQMGYPEEQIEAVRRFNILQSPALLAVMGAMWLALWFFLFSVRGHFRRLPGLVPGQRGARRV